MSNCKKHKAIIDDGFQPELVKNARFEGIFEIPVIEKPKRIFIPNGITPFSHRNETPTDNEAIGFFEMDLLFADVLRNPQAYTVRSEIQEHAPLTNEKNKFRMKLTSK